MDEITQYDYLLETTPAEDQDESPCGSFATAAAMTREALRLVAEVFCADAEDGIVLLLRFAGLSLAQIGERRGMSKQAVHKRILSMASKWPQLADALASTANYDEALAGMEIAMAKRLHEIHAKRKDLTRWMNRQN